MIYNLLSGLDINILLDHLPLTILIILALIVVGAQIIKSIDVWKEKRKKNIDKAVEEKQEENNLKQEFEKIHERFDNLEKRLDDSDGRMEKAEKTLKILTISDMHDIKSWIVEQYHRFYTEQGWIDAFNAETIERRYEDYQKEGGNSYIATLMERLHQLPMRPEDSLNHQDGNQRR